MKEFVKVALLSTIVILSSCKKDDPIDTITPTACTVDAPNDYTFMIDGSSTVSYSGQTQRLQMAGELSSALSDANTTASALMGMFAHEEGGMDFVGEGLNASSKQIKSKTAATGDAIAQMQLYNSIDAWFTDYADNVAPAIAAGTMAISGTAGMVGNRELNAKGMEYDQIIVKSLIGALCLDQVVNGYLSDAKIGDAVDNTTRVATEDNNSTAMEHHWDEGFGYIYGNSNSLSFSDSITGDGLLGKYLAKYPNYRVTVFDAFKKGRQAIVDNCSEVKNSQAQIIKETLSMVVADKAEYYLRDAANADDLSADYFHSLSEGYGFILSLQFTNTASGYAYFTNAEVNSMLSTLEAGNGFWDRTDAELIQMADAINAVTGL